jgi:hypothetical protein
VVGRRRKVLSWMGWPGPGWGRTEKGHTPVTGGLHTRSPAAAGRPSCWRPDTEDRQMTQNARDYAFPHANTAESRRLDLFAGRLDPLTKRRIRQLDLGPAVRCLERCLRR